MGFTTRKKMNIIVNAAKFARKYGDDLLHTDMKIREIPDLKKITAISMVTGKDKANQPMLVPIKIKDIKPGMSLAVFYKNKQSYESHIYADKIKEAFITDDSLLIATKNSLYTTKNFDMEKAVEKVYNTTDLSLLFEIKDKNLSFEEDEILKARIGIALTPTVVETDLPEEEMGMDMNEYSHFSTTDNSSDIDQRLSDKDAWYDYDDFEPDQCPICDDDDHDYDYDDSDHDWDD